MQLIDRRIGRNDLGCTSEISAGHSTNRGNDLLSRYFSLRSQKRPDSL
jgi:hypothetical protein